MYHPNYIIENISKELGRMGQRDQEMRRHRAEVGGRDRKADKQNIKRLKEIIAEFGWPTISEFGETASQNARLVVLHADHDLEFQKECLALIMSLKVGEIEQQFIAYLTDRVLVGEGKPQLYGTQFYENEDEEYGPCPIENEEGIEKRRYAMGMELFSVYKEKMIRKYG